MTLWGDFASEGPAAASLDDHAERRITLQITNCRVTEYNGGHRPRDIRGASVTWMISMSHGSLITWVSNHMDFGHMGIKNLNSSLIFTIFTHPPQAAPCPPTASLS